MRVKLHQPKCKKTILHDLEDKKMRSSSKDQTNDQETRLRKNGRKGYFSYDHNFWLPAMEAYAGNSPSSGKISSLIVPVCEVDLWDWL